MMGLYFEDVWIENSALWKTRIFGWVCEGCSGSYGISLYQDGQRLRSVLASEGKVEEDIGAPLGEEHGTNWATASEEDVLAIAGRLGLDYGTPESGYLVFTVDWSALASSPEQLAAFVEKCQEAARASPRWRWGGLTDSPRWQWLVLLWAVFVLIVIWALVTLDWGFWRNKLGF
jgi:hypothetical protein